MSKISCVLFDLGGVMINWDNSWLIQDVSDEFKVHEEILSEEFNKYLPEISSGKISEKEFWYRIGENIQSQKLMGIDESLLQRLFRKNVSLNDSVASLSKEIAKKGITVGILSNTEPVTYSVFEKMMPLEHFEHIFLSYEIGHVKPNPEIYHHVIENIPFEKEELFFIDDLKPNVESAIAQGIDAVQYSDFDKLLKELTQRELV